MSRVLAPGSAEAAGFDAAAIARIRERAAGWVAEGLTPALVVLAARRGRIALHEAFGVQTPDADSPPLRVDTVFPASSLGKPMTAAALLMLVEAGEVGLNEPIVDYLPDLEGDGVDRILVHHLLTHTSGLDDIAISQAQTERLRSRIALPPKPDTQHKTVQLLLAARNGCAVKHPPDEVMAYSTFGYDLIGEIIRRVSGRPLEAFMKARLFDPLEMNDSSYRLEPHQRDRVVRREPLENAYGADLNDERYLDTPWGGGGLNSVAIDIARFGQMLLNGGRYGERRILSPSTVREMTRNQVPDGIAEEQGMWAISRPPTYGYGLFVIGRDRWVINGRLLPEGTYLHNGMGGTNFWVDPVNEVVGVFCSVFVMPDAPTADDEMLPKLTPAMFQDMVTAAVDG